MEASHEQKHMRTYMHMPTHKNWDAQQDTKRETHEGACTQLDDDAQDAVHCCDQQISKPESEGPQYIWTNKKTWKEYIDKHRYVRIQFYFLGFFMSFSLMLLTPLTFFVLLFLLLLLSSFSCSCYIYLFLFSFNSLKNTQNSASGSNADSGSTDSGKTCLMLSENRQ